MQITDKQILVVRNARDKVQVAQFELWQEGTRFIIKRYTGQYLGVMSEQPDKIIEKGKAKRSTLIQAELEYNSLIKKSLDKGYKKFTDLTKIKWDNITPQQLNELVPTLRTDTSGNTKPQLAKSSEDCSVNVWDKEKFVSRKLDGVRCMMRWSEERNEVISISRGGKEYDVPTEHIRNNEVLENFLRDNPHIILDGELYVHGWALQRISGVARLKTWEERCNSLEYWIYDLVDGDKQFNERLDTLIDLNLLFENETHIKIVDHILTESWEKAKKLHDKFVMEGFEGLVARNPYKAYSPGKRNSDWIKLKSYRDDSFEIIGVSEGLRPEDMVFRLITKEGKEFEAKPMGTREVREEYLENWENYVGKIATVKFFAYSKDKIPMQPVFKAIRDEADLDEEE